MTEHCIVKMSSGSGGSEPPSVVAECECGWQRTEVLVGVEDLLRSPCDLYGDHMREVGQQEARAQMAYRLGQAHGVIQILLGACGTEEWERAEQKAHEVLAEVLGKDLSDQEATGA